MNKLLIEFLELAIVSIEEMESNIEYFSDEYNPYGNIHENSDKLKSILEQMKDISWLCY